MNDDEQLFPMHLSWNFPLLSQKNIDHSMTHISVESSVDQLHTKQKQILISDPQIMCYFIGKFKSKTYSFMS